MSIAVLLRRTALIAAIAALCQPALAADTAAAPSAAAVTPVRPTPPIEDFFDNADLDGAALSPSGKYLAARVGASGKRIRLAVFDLQSNTGKVVGAFSDADVGSFSWVNDERLVLYSASGISDPSHNGSNAGLFAINRDGTQFRQLIASNPSLSDSERQRHILPSSVRQLRQTLPGNSSAIYVLRPELDPREYLDTTAYVDLLRLDTLTGETTFVKRPARARSWLLDNDGEPRLMTSMEDGTSVMYYRDPASGLWRKLAAVALNEAGQPAWQPLDFGADGKLYVVARRDGQDKSALHTVDLNTGKLSDQPLVALADYDFSGTLVTDRHTLLGIHYLSDADGTVWFDPAMKALQAKVDALLPDTVNRLYPPSLPGSPWLMVKADSDVLPTATMSYNRETNTLTPVGSNHVRIKPAEMGAQTLVHYPARDGLSIPAWLTLPHGGGKHLPLVVLVHGPYLPYARGRSWEWSAPAQFLASRGYAVLEPEYRGTSGYGNAHLRAGLKQWGLAMQNDLADGARWLVAQGIAAPQRICIAGTSYGGYAAMMGLVNDGELYRCGVSRGGLIDLSWMLDGKHFGFASSINFGGAYYNLSQLVGDLDQDAAQLKATSPRAQLARIKRPLLLAYGDNDLSMPRADAMAFYNAVKQVNPDVEWIDYPKPGDDFGGAASRIAYWRRVERFLDKHIGAR